MVEGRDSLMLQSLVFVRRIVAAFVLMYVVTGVASAQQAQPIDSRTADQMYKSIQVLKGTPAAELILAMHYFRAALGVTCEYCHVEGNFPSDVKKPKEVARQMISMVFDINKNTFQGRQVVTCYTCHRGHVQPIGVPVYPLDEQMPEAPPPALPSVDQILAKYVQALGGEQAIRKVTSRVITATQYIPTGPGGTVPVPAQSEFYQKAPNLVLNVYRTPTYSISDGFDGTTKWAQDATGRVSEALKIDQVRARRSASLYESADLKQQYSRMTVSGVERVNDRDTYVVVANPPDDRPERLYFDRDTGLLLRKLTFLPTPIGDIPCEVNYDDYRDAGKGVKVPFMIRMIPANPRVEMGVIATVRVQKVEENLAIEDSKFAKPAPRPAPPR